MQLVEETSSTALQEERIQYDKTARKGARSSSSSTGGRAWRRCRWGCGIASVLAGAAIGGGYGAFRLVIVTGAARSRVAEHAFFEPGVANIAHRGGAGLWPENTMYAFERALQRPGSNVMLETDVRVSADGALVLIHDRSVNRTTGGSGEVQALTLAEIEALDAARQWRDGCPRQASRRTATSATSATTTMSRAICEESISVPTAAGAFSTLPGTTRFLVDVKHPAHCPVPTALCDLIRQYDMADRVLVNILSPSASMQFRSDCPMVATCANQQEQAEFAEVMRGGQAGLVESLHSLVRAAHYRPRYEALLLPRRKVTPELVLAAHAYGLRVYPWTIDDAAEMERARDMGVDGILTDYPDVLWRTLNQI